MTDNPGGKYRNYDYGYIPKEEKIPEGYTRTWRPCMECNSSVTYIDKDKVWHCLKCGWSCDVDGVTVSGNCVNKAVLDGKDIVDADCSAESENKENRMALMYSEYEFEMVKKGLEQGKTVAAISASIGRGTDALNHKIKAWREEGRLPESKRGRGKVVKAEEPVISDAESERIASPYDFPEFTAEYVKDLQVKLKEANLKLENEEANYEALELHVKGLEEQSKFYLKESQDYLSKLKEANDRIKALEAEPPTEQMQKPDKSRPQTSNERIANALLKAQDAGMELSDMSWTSSKSVVLSFILRVAKTETETQA